MSQLLLTEYYTELYPLQKNDIFCNFIENLQVMNMRQNIISKATEILVTGYFETHPEHSIPDIVKDFNLSYGIGVF